MPDEVLQTVAIRALPVDLSERAGTWFDGLLREFTIIASHRGNNGEAPSRLVTFVDEIGRRFERFGGQSEGAVAEARSTGLTSIDVELTLPTYAREAALELWDRLVEADEFCRQGQLLTLGAPPDVMEFTRWYLHEVAKQIDGDGPTPWPENSRLE